MSDEKPFSWKEEFKSFFKEVFTWEKLKKRWLSYFYPMTPLMGMMGPLLIWLALPPWHFREDLTLLGKIAAAMFCFVLGALCSRVAVWSFRRGPIDLSRGDQIFAGVTSWLVSAFMLFIMFGSDELDIGRGMVLGIMWVWGGFIFWRISRKVGEPEAGKES